MGTHPFRRNHVIGIFAVVFGLLTLFSGGTALFGGPEARDAVGKAVPFVLWFNFLAGFAYVFAGFVVLKDHPTAARLSLAIFFATLLVFLAFLVHVISGRPYEVRTVFAMILRCAVWLGISLAVWPRLKSGRFVP
ncbi:hypothetical protein [Alsobacter sp. R-9]